MMLSKRSLLLALAIVVTGSTTALAQSRIQLVQGRRAIRDKVTFVVELGHAKNEDPRSATVQNDVNIFTRFGERPATGMVYLDDKALGRFDESMSFNSNLAEITYGRHTLTLAFAAPAVLTDVLVSIRGFGVPREILEGDGNVPATSAGLEKRVADLEREVHDLEAEIANLKKKH